MTARMDGNGTDREGRRADDDRGQGQMFRRGPEKWRRTGRPAGVNLTPRIVVWTGPRVPGGKKDGGDEDESSHRGACPQVDRTGFGRGEWMDGRDRPNERLMRGALFSDPPPK